MHKKKAIKNKQSSLSLSETNKFFSYQKDVLKVPKREIFDRSDFPDFYTIKSSCVGDLVIKILTYYLNF
jgi:hypothetical protein